MAAVTNLATLGTVQLQQMSVREFTGGLENMSPDAIDKFRRMRKLREEHMKALEKFLRNNPHKRLQKRDKTSQKSARGQQRAQRQTKAKPAKKTNAAAAPAESDGYVRLGWRLQAWWEGVDVDAIKSRYELAKSTDKTFEANGRKRAQAAAAPAEEEEGRYDDIRLEVIGNLWGAGFSHPGGAKYALDLNKFVSLKSELTYLDLSAGLGGGTRAVARQYKLWLTGLERDKALAEAANDISIDEDMELQAPIRHYDPDNLQLEEAKYDVIFSRESLCSVDDRAEFLRRVGAALKPDGNLLLTDFVLTDRNRECDALRAWRESEPHTPRPWTMDEYRQSLNDLRYDVRVFEDVTAEYMPLIQSGWKRLVGTIEVGGLDPHFVDILMEEAKIWNSRHRALQSGRLRLLRVHALMRRGPKRALSDSMKVD